KGRLDYARRRHFFEVDHDNAGTIIDITSGLGAPIKLRYGVVDRCGFIAVKGAGVECFDEPHSVALSYIPKDSFDMINQSKIPSGSVIGIVWKNPIVGDKLGSDVLLSHIGLVIRKDGELVVRHASQPARRVIEQPFDEFLDKQTARWDKWGVKIWAASDEWTKGK
ncbi:MAG: DUF1460 domain-containing protein, partial [Alphaproteobacteria bacterium]|nr:DUF1460 domain-containing protein [Alphaproteobacteria bacterium]